MKTRRIYFYKNLSIGSIPAKYFGPMMKERPGKTKSRSQKHLLTLFTYLGFLSLGLPDSIAGIVWPSVSTYYHIPIGNFGLLLVIFFCGYITSSLSTSSILQHIRLGELLASSCLFVFISLIGFSTSPTWTIYLVNSLIAGLGAGAIDTGLNSYAARNFSARHMSWLHAFWGVGATLGAFITTSTLKYHLEWWWAFRIIAFTLTPLTLCFFLYRKLWDEKKSNPSVSTTEESKSTAYFQEAICHPIVWVQSLTFFIYVGAEATVGQWSFTLLTNYRNLSESTAGIAVTSYWAALTMGRFLLGSIADHIGVLRLLCFSVSFSLVGGLAFVFAPWIWGNILGLIILGFSFSSIYPGMMTLTPSRFGKLSDTAVGFQVTFALLGQVIIPSVGGLILKGFGIFWINCMLGCLLLLLWIIVTSLFCTPRNPIKTTFSSVQ